MSLSSSGNNEQFTNMSVFKNSTEISPFYSIVEDSSSVLENGYIFNVSRGDSVIFTIEKTGTDSTMGGTKDRIIVIN